MVDSNKGNSGPSYCNVNVYCNSILPRGLVYNCTRDDNYCWATELIVNFTGSRHQGTKDAAFKIHIALTIPLVCSIVGYLWW